MERVGGLAAADSPIESMPEDCSVGILDFGPIPEKAFAV
jgi:hypothetical protein